jgi:hypothetical protein
MCTTPGKVETGAVAEVAEPDSIRAVRRCFRKIDRDEMQRPSAKNGMFHYIASCGYVDEYVRKELSDDD